MKLCETTGEDGPGLERRAPFLGVTVEGYTARASLAFPGVGSAQSRGTSKKPHLKLSSGAPGQGPHEISSARGSCDRKIQPLFFSQKDGIWGSHKSFVRWTGEGSCDVGEQNGEEKTPLHDTVDGRGRGDMWQYCRPGFFLLISIPSAFDGRPLKGTAHGITVIAKESAQAPSHLPNWK